LLEPVPTRGKVAAYRRSQAGSGLLVGHIEWKPRAYRGPTCRRSVQRAKAIVKVFVLLVTRLVWGQPPVSYQTVFDTREACAAAQRAAIAEQQRINGVDGGRARFRGTNCLLGRPGSLRNATAESVGLEQRASGGSPSIGLAYRTARW